MKLAPKLMRRYQVECHGDLADERQMQDYTADADTAKLLVDEFHNIDKDSIVPAMLAWLYYGKCYETMVNQLEAEANNPRNNFIEQKIAAIMIRVVIKSSIRNKMRTKEDWENFRREKKAACGLLRHSSARNMGYRFIEIIKVVHIVAIVRMAGHGAKTVIFGYLRYFILAMVLSEGTHLPLHTYFAKRAVHHRLVQYSEQCGADTYIFILHSPGLWNYILICFHCRQFCLFHPICASHPTVGILPYCQP